MVKKGTTKPTNKNNKINKAVNLFFNKVVEDFLFYFYCEDTDIFALKTKFSTYMGFLLIDNEEDYEGLDPYNAHNGVASWAESDSLTETALDTARFWPALPGLKKIILPMRDSRPPRPAASKGGRS